MARLLEVLPRELYFLCEVKKLASCIVHIQNTSEGKHVAFKVKTTSPENYCVRPNSGIMIPNGKYDFTVYKKSQESIVPSHMQCKDGFLIMSTIVEHDTREEEITQAMFEEDQRYIEETELKVLLLSSHSSHVNHMEELERENLELKEAEKLMTYLKSDNENMREDLVKAWVNQKMLEEILKLTQDLYNLESKNRDMEGKLDKAKGTRERLEREKLTLKEEKNILESKNRDMKRELDEAKGSQERLENEKLELTKEKNILESENRDMEGMLDEAIKLNQMLEIKLNVILPTVVQQTPADQNQSQ